MPSIVSLAGRRARGVCSPGLGLAAYDTPAIVLSLSGGHRPPSSSRSIFIVQPAPLETLNAAAVVFNDARPYISLNGLEPYPGVSRHHNTCQPPWMQLSLSNETPGAGRAVLVLMDANEALPSVPVPSPTWVQ